MHNFPILTRCSISVQSKKCDQAHLIVVLIGLLKSSCFIYNELIWFHLFIMSWWLHEPFIELVTIFNLPQLRWDQCTGDNPDSKQFSQILCQWNAFRRRCIWIPQGSWGQQSSAALKMGQEKMLPLHLPLAPFCLEVSKQGHQSQVSVILLVHCCQLGLIHNKE